jgi:hypothetical protein
MGAGIAVTGVLLVHIVFRGPERTASAAADETDATEAVAAQ